MENEPKRKRRAIVLAESPYKGAYGKSERDDTFIQEANNLRQFYKRTNPDVDFQIVPFYGDRETVQSSLQGITPEDEVFVFGHGGPILGGLDNSELAEIFKQSGVRNCSFGSCDFGKYIEPFKSIPNVTYRDKGSWWGVNPRADDLITAMYSKASNPEPKSMNDIVSIFKPKQGVHFNKLFNRTPEQPVRTVSRPNPFNF